MLTNATEDFVPQFGDEEDVTQANEEIDEAVHRSAFNVPWNKESRRFSYFKS